MYRIKFPIWAMLQMAEEIWKEMEEYEFLMSDAKEV